MEHMIVAWDNDEHTVVHLTINPGWSWKEYYDINPTIVDMMRSTEKTVYLIVDHLNTSFVPMGVFMHARNLFAAYPANCDLIIITTPNVLVQRLVTVFQATYKGGLGARVKPAASIADAYKLMEQSAREHAAGTR